MKRYVQILLLFACAALLLARVEAETMEERKRRITRKYLRERVDITYSEEVVPGTEPGVEDVLASEVFSRQDVELEREPVGAPLPPPVRQPAPRTENRNWLLSEPEDSADPYANPFADPFAPKESKDQPNGDDWSVWGTEREPAPYTDTKREGRSSWREYDSFSGQQPGSYNPTRQEERFNPRTSFGEGTQWGVPQQRGSAPGFSKGTDFQGVNPYNSIFNPTRTQSTFPRETETQGEQSYESDFQPSAGGYTPYKSPYQAEREKRQEQRGGYIPYKSPYQTQREQQQERWGGYSAPKQEYRRPDIFQEWKKRNPAQFNPTADDAYIEEMMPKTRR